VDPSSSKARLHDLVAARELVPIPLDLSCLLLCRLAGRDIDLASEMEALDALAAGVEDRSFEGVIDALFAGATPFRGNTANYYDIANSLLTDVRRSGLGIPISLSVLAMEVARRVGVTMQGIGMPGHFLVGNGESLFADPFHGAAVFGADQARELFERVGGGTAAWNDGYLRPATNTEILFRVVNNIKVACSRSFADRHHLPWVLEVLSWFPQGAEFDPAAAARIMAPFN
jgi:regulator of sirC expression with transglutaminase-like and TPR domain